MQRILSRKGCFHAEDFVVQRIILHRGGCHVQDVFSQRIFHAKDFFAQRIFLRISYRARYTNDWFSDQLQDHFLTNWRGILKISERFLKRTKQIIKTSLIFEKKNHILGYSKEALSHIFQFS
jgi:hypothetical protein